MLTKVEMIPGDKGAFEITLDGELIYSKLSSGRHAKPGEVKAAFEARVGPPVL